MAAVLFLATHCLIGLASSNGGDSERQSLLTVDADTYTVLSIEVLGHFTYFRQTNRVSLKRYGLADNRLLSTDILLETQIDRNANAVDRPPVATQTDTSPTTLAATLGKENRPFAGYVRTPKFPFEVGEDGISIDRNGTRTTVLSSTDLSVRVPDFPERGEYGAFEVVGVQGGGRDPWFIVIRSSDWLADTGSFEQVIAIP